MLLLHKGLFLLTPLIKLYITSQKKNSKNNRKQWTFRVIFKISRIYYTYFCFSKRLIKLYIIHSSACLVLFSESID